MKKSLPSCFVDYEQWLLFWLSNRKVLMGLTVYCKQLWGLARCHVFLFWHVISRPQRVKLLYCKCVMHGSWSLDLHWCHALKNAVVNFASIVNSLKLSAYRFWVKYCLVDSAIMKLVNFDRPEVLCLTCFLIHWDEY